MFAYRNAKQSDLWLALSNEGRRDRSIPIEVNITAVMDTWTHYKVKYNYP